MSKQMINTTNRIQYRCYKNLQMKTRMKMQLIII